MRRPPKYLSPGLIKDMTPENLDGMTAPEIMTTLRQGVLTTWARVMAHAVAATPTPLKMQGLVSLTGMTRRQPGSNVYLSTYWDLPTGLDGSGGVPLYHLADRLVQSAPREEEEEDLWRAFYEDLREDLAPRPSLLTIEQMYQQGYIGACHLRYGPDTTEGRALAYRNAVVRWLVDVALTNDEGLELVALPVTLTPYGIIVEPDFELPPLKKS